MTRVDAPWPKYEPSIRLVPWLLAAVCAAAFLGASWATSDIPRLRPDTASYLFFDPSRPVGYPLFLWIVRKLGNALLAAPFQMAMLATSLFLLGWAFYEWTKSALLSLLFQLALLASPEMWKFAPGLVTEALATSTVALWCAQLLRMLRGAHVRAITYLTLASSVAMLIKPGLIPLFLGTAVATFLLRDRSERGRALVITAAGLAISLAVTPLANLLVHGSTASGSPVARGLLQHTLFCSAAADPADADATFVERNARTVRDNVSRAPGNMQPVLQGLYSGKLRFGLIIPTLGRRHGLDAGWRTDPLIMRIAVERILANPTCYAASVANSYWAMATYKTYSSAETRELKQYLTAHPPIEVAPVPLLPRDEQMAIGAAEEVGAAEARRPGRQTFEPPTGRPLPLIWAARALYAGAAALGLLALAILLFARSAFPLPLRQVAFVVAALGVVFHGVLLLTAAVELPLTRYLVPLWPVVCLMLAISVTYALSTIGFRGVAALETASA